MYSLSSNVHYSSPEIDSQLRAFELRRRFVRFGPSQGRSDGRQKFPYGKGFYDVIIRTGIERENLVLFRISDGHHDDWPGEGQSNLAACLKPGHTGHIHIQQNQIRMLENNRFDGILPLLRQYNVIAATRKGGL